MEQPKASQPASKDPRPMGADLVKHFDSLTVPELFSVSALIAWLRKPFQRHAKTYTFKQRLAAHSRRAGAEPIATDVTPSEVRN